MKLLLTSAVVVGTLVLAVKDSSVALAGAQTSAGDVLAFEVASVKPNHSADGPFNGGYCRGMDTNVSSAPRRAAPTPLGRCVFRTITLDQLVWLAYFRGGIASLEPDQMVIGGPAWARSETFDVEGKAIDPPDVLKENALWAMVRTFLADRFKLRFHRETKEVPGFALVPGTNRSKLVPAANSEGGERVFGTRAPSTGQFVLNGRNASMSMLAGAIAQFGGPLVIDKTDLAGTYDFELTWQLDDAATIKGRPVVHNDGTGPSLSTALLEQLGLRLVSERIPIEFIVIDSAERPTGNDF